MFSAAQVGWWILDQTRLALNERDRLLALYDADARAVSAAFGDDPERLGELMPHLEMDAERGVATVRAAARDSVVAAASSRINRYRWEGGFFLLVLVGAMVVLTRTIRHDGELRRRQQNFLAAVSHEFKSPLASLRLSAETLMTDEVSGGVRRLGGRMLKDCDRLLRMVENLLDATRLEEGRLAPQAEKGPLRLLDAVGAAVLTHREEARRGGVAIHVSVAPGPVGGRGPDQHGSGAREPARQRGQGLSCGRGRQHLGRSGTGRQAGAHGRPGTTAAGSRPRTPR